MTRLQSFALLLLRCALALPFFRSGLTKWDAPFQLSPGALYLFAEEFRLHLPWGEVPYPLPALTAHAAGVAEILLPLLLVLGLGTRVTALGLLGMTAVIQLTVPDGWANFHLSWTAMAITLVAWGGGNWSLDAVARRFKPARRT